jgi:hypothetical protein
VALGDPVSLDTIGSRLMKATKKHLNFHCSRCASYFLRKSFTVSSAKEIQKGPLLNSPEIYHCRSYLAEFDLTWSDLRAETHEHSSVVTDQLIAGRRVWLFEILFRLQLRNSDGLGICPPSCNLSSLVDIPRPSIYQSHLTQI